MPDKPTDSPAARTEREAQALRANLRRRKQQAQAREAARNDAQPDDEPIAPPADETA